MYVSDVVDHFPYGKSLRSNGGAERYLSTHHQRDPETGWDHRGARLYDGETARFLGVDPLAADYPAWSGYNYVVGNPVLYVDPDGREAWIEEADDNGSISFIAEEGDNLQTFVQQYDVTEEEAATIFGKQCCNIETTFEAGEVIHTDLADPLRLNIKGEGVSDQDAINHLRFALIHGSVAKNYEVDLHDYFQNLDPRHTFGEYRLEGLMQMGGEAVPVFIDMKGGWNLNVNTYPTNNREGPVKNGQPTFNFEYFGPKGQPVFLIQTPLNDKYFDPAFEFLRNPKSR